MGNVFEKIWRRIAGVFRKQKRITAGRVQCIGESGRMAAWFDERAAWVESATGYKFKRRARVYVVKPSVIVYSRSLRRRVGVLETGNCGETVGDTVRIAYGADGVFDIPPQIAEHELAHVLEYQHGLPGDHYSGWRGKIWAWFPQGKARSAVVGGRLAGDNWDDIGISGVV